MGMTKRHFKRLVILPCIIIILQGLIIIKQVLTIVSNFIVRRNVPAVVRTPEERFCGLEAVGYAFKSHYVALPIGGGKTLPRVHYVDEGPRDGEIILCLHGEPSWSFLYRHMIQRLVKSGFRVIAPDFIGFGKSDKFTFPEAYSHELHTQTLRLLLDYLGVNDVTLVCQDWGGLTGLSVVKDSPHLFSRLVIMNTGLPAGSELAISTITQITPFMAWRSFAELLGTSIPVYHIFKKALMNPYPAILDGYSAPFPSSLYKAGAARWPLLVPLNSHTPVAADMQATRNFLATEWKNPALLMFSTRDPITKGQEKTFQRLIPHAITKTIEGAGHFLQEDQGEEISSHIIGFINKKF